MNGLLGINVRILGINRDNTLAYLARLRPAFSVIMNDPDLARSAKLLGTRVIYRRKTADDNDDTMHSDPAAFIRRRAAAAPTADYIYTFNELGLTADHAAAEIACMKAADEIGRKCCVLNAATHKSPAEWDAVRPAVEYAAQHGHILGCHVYLDGITDAGAWNFTGITGRYGATVVLTEFGYIQSIRNPFNGWRGALEDTEYADWLTEHSRILALRNLPACVFSFDSWYSFGVHDAPPVTDRLVNLNVTTLWHGAAPPPVQPPAPPVVVPPVEAWRDGLRDAARRLRAEAAQLDALANE